ncbi:MAG: helix-turn-helix domain-containing protein [Kiritimatiellia bacterium]|jgi:AcrR family transcriptional regulator|nr:helix-turn-helix domain-containing protein [Pseudomonadales bacterium]MDP6472589.1 helix-turn-helix domain-containing protein [Pseudomonadales bacterium]MDP6829260.1 helix-turn-helix domain-containing protein [Pseudomonadales bacterium]MDP7022784.1 helix-turn-helix domain-containing protein [Kiritimatiellia bacterium]|tara:strand:- start:49 stop:684 length:636 start_codon:yes stop_codon:yes gene_type:complete
MRWVREPQQDRSARTRAGILDAAEKLLAEEGLEALTIAAIARVARCSVGSVYHHFQDKQTVIYAVLDRVSNDTYRTAQEGLEPSVWKDVPLLDIFEGYLRYSLKMGRRFAGVSIAQQRLALEDPHIRDRMESNARKTNELILRLLRAREFEVGHPDPKTAMPLVLHMMRSVLSQRSLQRAMKSSDFLLRQSDEALIRELLAMARAYLQISA